MGRTRYVTLPRDASPGRHGAAPTPLEAVRLFHRLATPLRFRVCRDAEGWPVIPGRFGRIEWHDEACLAVYTDRPRLVPRLWAIPGIQRWQVGDQEARGLFPPEALPAVAALIRARRRRRGRPLTPEQALRLRAGARVRRPSPA